jgi:CopG family transcriptional regulator, nickel-responsive regulator
MERHTISLDAQLSEQFDRFMHRHGYENRSEAIRDLIRERLEADRLEQDENGYCVATLSYIYNHHERALASQVTAVHHLHHDLTLSSMHVHMDHDNCLEVVFIRGKIPDVRSFADKVIAMRGVRHGKLHLVPVALSQALHTHSAGAHTHLSPLT